MSVTITPEHLDYIDAAQKRVTSEGRFLEKRSTLVLVEGSTSADFPTDLVEFYALYDGFQPLQRAQWSDFLKWRTGGDPSVTGEWLCYVTLGRSFQFFPAAASGKTLDIIYAYRSTTITSDSTLEVTGETERLVERLASAYLLMDDGQPELAQAELDGYYGDLARLRRRFHAAHGKTRRIGVRGFTPRTYRPANDVDVR